MQFINQHNKGINRCAVVLASAFLSPGCTDDGQLEEEWAAEERAAEELTTEELATEELAAEGTYTLDPMAASATDAEDPIVTSGGELPQRTCVIPRTDVVEEIVIGLGNGGDWAGCHDYCPAGAFAYAVQLQSMTFKGAHRDDQALLGIALRCYNRATGTDQGEITSTGGPPNWGDWLPYVYTFPFNMDNPIIGGKMKIVPPQGKGDDMGATAVQMVSMNGVWIQPDSHTAFGEWNSGRSCPAGSAVCGIETRFDYDSGKWKDDSALNGVSLKCCTF